MKLLPKEINHISIITSEFHLKRCYAILKKNYPNISVTMTPSKDSFLIKTIGIRRIPEEVLQLIKHIY